MRKEIIKDNVITLKQKKKFFKYALDIYTGKIKVTESISNWRLIEHGFCNIYRQFFVDESSPNDSPYVNGFELLPELLKYKPINTFYNCFNRESNDSSQFWFPIGSDKNDDRIKICKEILKELNSTTITCPDCYGNGQYSTSHEFKHCKMCNGSGKIKKK